MPVYLQKIISAYLSDRRVNDSLPGWKTRCIEVCRGVPQGSVLGPDLWNLLYDSLLRIALPQDGRIIAFANDIALIPTAQVPFLLKERLEAAFSDVVDWLEVH